MSLRKYLVLSSMKFLAVALLALCLVQANNAQLGALTGRLTGALSAASNAANNAASNAAGSLLDRVSGTAQGLINSTTNLNINQLTELAGTLEPEELLETIQTATADVASKVSGLQDVVGSVQSAATSAVQNLNLPSSVKNVLEKAITVGAEVAECAVVTGQNLSENGASSPIKCVTDKIKEITTLGKNIASLVPRTKSLAQTSAAEFKSCSEQNTSAIRLRACQVFKLAPIAVKSISLVKDTASYTIQATKLATTLRTDMTVCAGKITALSTVEAAKFAKNVVSCVATLESGNN